MACKLGLFGYVRKSLLCSHDFLYCKDVHYSVKVDDKGLVDRDIKFIVGLGEVVREGKVIDLGSLFWRKEELDHHGDGAGKGVFVIFGFE